MTEVGARRGLDRGPRRAGKRLWRRGRSHGGSVPEQDGAPPFVTRKWNVWRKKRFFFFYRRNEPHDVGGRQPGGCSFFKLIVINKKPVQLARGQVNNSKSWMFNCMSAAESSELVMQKVLFVTNVLKAQFAEKPGHLKLKYAKKIEPNRLKSLEKIKMSARKIGLHWCIFPGRILIISLHDSGEGSPHCPQVGSWHLDFFSFLKRICSSSSLTMVRNVFHFRQDNPKSSEGLKTHPDKRGV